MVKQKVKTKAQIPQNKFKRLLSKINWSEFWIWVGGLVVVGTFVAIAIIYEQNYERIATLPTNDLNFNSANAEFSDLSRTRYEFPTNNNQTLVGYNYYKTDAPKALIIFVHGLGGAHDYYKPLINSLTNHDYWVFAFDGLGNGESDGDSQIGFEQHVIDLNAAINFVKSNPDFDNLEISLVGHSWGGYAVAAILNYRQDVSSVVSLAGPSSAVDIEINFIEQKAGWIANLAKPFLWLLETSKFGALAWATGLDGLNSSNVPALIVARSDDSVVSIEYGYQLYKDKVTRPLEYVLYGYRDHFPYLNDEAYRVWNEYQEHLSDDYWDEPMREIYDKYNLDWESDAISENPEAWAEATKLLNSEFPSDFWQTAIDENLINQIDVFIAKNL